MATLRNVSLASGLFWLASGGAAYATDCCVLNPSFSLHSSGDCSIEGNVETCSAIEKAAAKKADLLAFLAEEVGGGPFPSGAFIYVCPLDPDDPLPVTSGASFVKDKDSFSVDVTAYLKLYVYFLQLIFQGTFDFNTAEEKSKDEFPMALLIAGSSGGTTSIRLTGIGKESYNAKPIDQDNMQQVSAKVSGSVAADPDVTNTLKGETVLVEGKLTCTTKETFDRD